MTGASSGIGLELARQFALNGFDLVINAEDHERLDDPARVAQQGFEALMAGERRVVGGSLRTKVSEAANKVLPDQVKAAVHKKMAEPGSGS